MDDFLSVEEKPLSESAGVKAFYLSCGMVRSFHPTALKAAGAGWPPKVGHSHNGIQHQ